MRFGARLTIRGTEVEWNIVGGVKDYWVVRDGVRTKERFEPLGQPPDRRVSETEAEVGAPGLFDPLPPLDREERVRAETARKREVLGTLEQARADIIARLRLGMRALWFKRRLSDRDATVNGNDARDLLDTYKGIPGPEELPRAFMAAVFRGGCWEHDGTYSPSSAPGSHARELKNYRYVNCEEGS